MKRRAALAAIALVAGLTACSPIQALQHGPHHHASTCVVTYPGDPNGPAACIHGKPVFAPPDWVVGNSATPYPNGDPGDPFTSDDPSVQPTPIPHGP